MDNRLHEILLELGFESKSAPVYDFKSFVSLQIESMFYKQFEIVVLQPCGECKEVSDALGVLLLEFAKWSFLIFAPFQLRPGRWCENHGVSVHGMAAFFYPICFCFGVGVDNRFAATYTIAGPGAAEIDCCVSISQQDDDHFVLSFKPPVVLWRGNNPNPLLSMSLSCCGLGFKGVRVDKRRFFSTIRRIPAFPTTFLFSDQFIETLHEIIVSKVLVSQTAYHDDYDELLLFCKGLYILKNTFVRRIQRAWRRCMNDPSFMVCKRRLLREHNELGLI